MGKIVVTSGAIIRRYDRDKVKPSIDVTIKVADAIGVSLDYVVRKTFLAVNQKTLIRNEEVNKLLANAKEQVNLLIDALVGDFKAKETHSV